MHYDFFTLNTEARAHAPENRGRGIIMQGQSTEFDNNVLRLSHVKL